MRFFRFTPVFFVLLITAACSRKPYFSSASHSHLSLESERDDSLLLKTISPYKAGHDAQMNEVLVYAESALVKEQPESTLGNFVCDAIFKRMQREALNGPENLIALRNPDIVIMNNGGLRVSLPQGAITRGKIYELMPFENRVVCVNLKWKELKQLLDFIAEKGGIPLSGLQMKIKDKKAAEIKINGQLPDTNRVYNVITSDYLANGGDKMEFFKSNSGYYDFNILVRDVLIDACKKLHAEGKKLDAVKDERISVSE